MQILLLMGLVLSSNDSLDIIPPFDDLLRGDASNDGQVNVADPVYISAFLFQGGNAPSCMDAADANDDGAVNNTDVVYLYSFLFTGGPRPPAPYPYCGQDTTQDNLNCLSSACP
jgi:hypothetical protein